MKKDKQKNIWQWQGKVAALMPLVIMLLLGWSRTADADLSSWNKNFNKGFLVDPGGAPSQTTQPYFVGMQWLGDINNTWYLSIADEYGREKWSHQGSGTIGNPSFITGSAVYFNGTIYAFAPYVSSIIGNNGRSVSEMSTIFVTTVDPVTWTEVNPKVVVLHEMDKPWDLKNGMGAVVAGGQIYIFMSGSSTSLPMVYSSSDGQNWGYMSTTGAPNYPTVHDAITFIDPKDGKTKVMVVLSQVNGNNLMPLLPAVSIFDPSTATWGPINPLPQEALPSGTYGMHASAWFGSWRTTQLGDHTCSTYTWNSGNTDAHLHVLGALWTGDKDYLVHWYLDPATESWRFDPSGCDADLQALLWIPQGEPSCGGAKNRTPAPLGPGYRKTAASGCTSGDDCLQQAMWSASCGWWWQSSGPSWVNDSDLWVPTPVWKGKGTAQTGPWTYKTVDTSNPSDPAFGNDPAIYQSMADTIRINGMVMGPPPFPIDPQWTGPVDWSETSNVQLGRSSGTTSGTLSTFSTSITAGVVGTVSAPFVQGKEGLSFEYGYASTHTMENSFTSAYTWTLGTKDQTQATLGKQGWMVGHAPIIWPTSYLATSARDPGPTGTYMGYSQMLLSVGEAQSLFWPYSLTNPSDTSYPMGFLLSGVQPMPATTDVQGWNINQGGAMQDWSDTSTGNWSVVGGKAGSGQFTIGVLNMGSLQNKQFVKSTTKDDTWSNSYTGTWSNSLKIGTKGNNVTTDLDLSFGYETGGSRSTTFEQNMETSYLAPTFQGGFSEVYVQPYLLQALTYNAPWVPKGYKGPLPWAVTWDVTYAAQTSSMLGAPEIIHAQALPPKAASGRITGYATPNTPTDKPASTTSLNMVVDQVRDDSYTITEGSLSYNGPGDEVIPVAMTADEFNPFTGVSVTLNGYKLNANIRKGAWTRSSHVWKYVSNNGTDKLKLTLDFGAKTWGMSVSKIELGDRFAGLNHMVAVTIDLNGRYSLSTRIPHQMAYAWQADLTALDQPIWVRSINVTRDFVGKGKVNLNGRITEAVRSVGDTSLVLNGEVKNYPLMSKVKNFMKKTMKKGILYYRDDNSNLRANLSNGAWSCQVDTNVFKHPLPFHHGDVQLDLRVGGKAYFNASIHPDFYVMKMRYKKP